LRETFYKKFPSKEAFTVFMISTGIDIESIERLGALAGNSRFLKRVFTVGEIGYSAGKRVPHRHLAGRFAAKEACAKALKTGLGAGVSLRDIEVVNAVDGRPGLRLFSRANEILGERTVFLSIGYQGDMAMALVVIE
jgi:holo-[acyl-carrier protein] synthase